VITTGIHEAKTRRCTTVGGVTTSYVYDGPRLVEERRGTDVIRYFDGPGIDEHLAVQDGAGTVTYLASDHLGSVTDVTSTTGGTILSRKYDPWGEMITGAGSSGYAFTGRSWDADTGLYYYRARYYDPKIGRFISEDPIGFSGGLNFYAYVRNNPINRVDPSGLSDIGWPGTRGPNPPSPPQPPQPPQWGVSISCWRNTGYDWLGDCAYNQLQTPCNASCIPATGPSCHDYSGHGGCPPTLGYAMQFWVAPDGSKVCDIVGAHIELGPVPCVCGDISNMPGPR
jgi:RHS repeat-associated protein